MIKSVLPKIKMNLEDYQVIKEGMATVLTPKTEKVFYNPIQQFNRDLSVMGIKAWSEVYQKSKVGARDYKKRKLEDGRYIRILEALSATGLRALRYGHEIPEVKTVVANDLISDAIKSINRNIEYNKLEEIVESNQADATKYMNSDKMGDKFHVIDLDPYGSATPFIDGAIQSIKDDGLLLVTCTDAAVLAGLGYPEKCFSLYGGNNFGSGMMGNEMNHEVGIRLILGMISREAAKYKKTIKPLMSVSIDFYFRLFIMVKTSPLEVKKLASNTMITYHCKGCGENMNQPLGRIEGFKFQLPKLTSIGQDKCEYCEHQYNVAGPMWGAPIHDLNFIEALLKVNQESDETVYQTKKRIKGMMTLCFNELNNQPFYFNLNQISSIFKSPPISIDQFAKALGNYNGLDGWDISLTHAKKNCIKTNAPWETILKINIIWMIKQNEKLIKEYEAKLPNGELEEKITKLRENNLVSTRITPGMIGHKIIENLPVSAEEIAEIDFDTENALSKKIAVLRNLKLVRYQENPTKNWGPKAKPK